MTSPDFMYPQPTDDELAAQQPSTAALGLGNHVHGASHSHGSVVGQTPASLNTETDHDGTSPAGTNRPLLGKLALVLTIIAAGLSLLVSIILGITIGPMENTGGYYFTDAPSWYQNLAIAFAGLQVLCAAPGITGLIMGIVAAATSRARTQGIVAIAIAVLAPFISFGFFMILSFTFA
ncbi:hypothetical protein BAURA86_02371 [Brevibacterium aurantiacum]|uniref:Uncharacterized protein n=1 Tax=Brevibacterium aurantiacum TaxID=273384 RepID=A0A2H1K3W4_BREAU|nr:hypothetical protein [Brevibacterium aurantiacum]SMX94329.1 hypothetical protein BAURA86_02371 [Brevibacterium aurantiacum]